ncbi:MAG: SixA phosphatase family protein [Saprospiraceae bacterium]
MKQGNKNSESLNIFLVRHAEKEKGKDPKLSPEGKIRAIKLGEKLQEIALDAIYTTDYNRTKETASFANAKQKKTLDLQLYNPRDLEAFAQEIRKKHSVGQTILIVGHSNTTPHLANILTGTEDYPQFEEHDYSNLYLISIKDSNQVNLEQLKL